MVRALGKAFEQRNPHGFVVESRPGANTIIAANACKAAPPDGSTICLLSRSSCRSIRRSTRTLSYDPLKDFEPITNLAFAQQVLILNKSVPVKDFKELVAYSKQHPDKLNFGSFGVGGDSHSIIEWLKHETGAKHDPHSLQRRVRGHAGVQGRRHADDLSDRRQSRPHAPDQGGRGQRPAGAGLEAQSAHSRRALVRRGRPAGAPLGLRDLVRHVRAQGHAGERSSTSSTPSSPRSSRRRRSPSSS